MAVRRLVGLAAALAALCARAGAGDAALDQATGRIGPAGEAAARTMVSEWVRRVASDQVHGVIQGPGTRIASQAPFPYDHLVAPGGIKADMAWGCAAPTASLLFRAYEITGDRDALRAGLAHCDFLLRAQEPEGYWTTTCIVEPSGRIWTPTIRQVCRLQDGHQYGPFALLLHAHRLTGDERYRRAALRCADAVLRVQNADGSWPDQWDFAEPADSGPWSGPRGVRVGGSFNDGATSDQMRMMITAYHVTGDRKYIASIGRIGRWILATRLGKGSVWGWCQQYGPDQRPIAARHFEMPVIEPRTFSRFVGPMCAWFYALTGDRRYLAAMASGYAWTRGVRSPGGWAYQYLADGTPVFSFQYRLYRMDRPGTWPPDSIMGSHRWVKQVSTEKVDLGPVEAILAFTRRRGLDGLRARIAGEDAPTAAEYRQMRLAAARRAAGMPGVPPDVPGRKPKPAARRAAERAAAALEYLADLRVARGLVSPAEIARRRGGFSAALIRSGAEAVGDWTLGAMAVRRWLPAPIGSAARPAGTR